MHSFKDRNGRDWIIELNVSAKKRAKAVTGVDISTFPSDPRSFGEFLEDDERIVDFLAVLCEAQIKEAGIARDQFDALFAGDVTAEAAEALTQEIVDFFRDPGVRANLRRMMVLAQSAARQAQVDGARRLAEMESDLPSLVQKLTRPSSTSPGNAESIPELSPSTN